MGTAGHIDHGKTALVKALTGIDTDRTREEKERGISIELGFAPLLLPTGQRIGIVDVPGHERFIRNMLAGAGGMDLILLVIDAREGMMPQTREHVDILQMLELTEGIVVVTKVDLVDDEWLLLMHEEIRSQLRGTFLENSPLVDVSALTGQGLDELRVVIAKSISHVQPKSSVGALRLPLDRVFTVTGFGTVVTGTVWRGQVHVGDMMELLPAKEQVRIRSIQVHGEQVQTAVAGQRAAVAFTSVRTDVRRGMTLAEPKVLNPSRLLDVRIRVLPDSPFALHHRTRVRFYNGTAEVIGRMLLLRDQEVLAGEEGLAQILLEQPVVVEARDHFVIRSFSPMHTLGGGVVIDPHPVRLHRRHSEAVFEQLMRREGGSLHERVLDAIISDPELSLVDLASLTGALQEEVEATRMELVAFGEVICYEGQLWIPTSRMAAWASEFLVGLDDYYRKNTYDVWMPKSVVYQMLKALGVPMRVQDVLLQDLSENGHIVVETERVQKEGRQVSLSLEEKKISSLIMDQMKEHPFSPPTVQELEKDYKGQEKRVRQVLHALVQADEVTFLNQEIFLSPRALLHVEAAVRELYDEQGPFTVADVRDQLATSRKFAVAILEYFDRQKKTRRNGDVRVYLRRG